MKMLETEAKPDVAAPSKTASFRVLWVLGILIHFIAINQPLLDAHSTRQTQTADWIYNAGQEDGLPLSAEVSWHGDMHARLVLEFPLYNYLVMPIWRMIGNLDVAGKLVSIVLWAISFVVLQAIWRQILTPRQTFWANLLFVFAPLSVFFGQAVMPEMLIQLLAFTVVYYALIYSKTESLVHYSIFAAAGLIGLLVKSLEISHLYIFFLALVWRKDGFKVVTRPHHWIAGTLTLLIFLGWMRHIDAVNSSGIPEWTASNSSRDFLGTWQDRFNWHFYVKTSAYVAAFVAGPVGLLIAAAGFKVRTERNRAGFWWFYSLAFFYLVWGIRTAGWHSYYNLPALGPICFLFGLGMPIVQDRIRSALAQPTQYRAAFATLCVAIFLPLIGCSAYLYRKDKVILQAALWMKQHTPENDLILLRMNHRRDINDYPEYAVFSYYAKRRSWNDTTKLRPVERARAIEKCNWAVMTRPPRGSTWAERVRDKIGRYVPLQEPENWPPLANEFHAVHSTDNFVIFERIRKAG
jgi:hypothetical protein